MGEPLWLQPLPDPEERYEAREARRARVRLRPAAPAAGAARGARAARRARLPRRRGRGDARQQPRPRSTAGCSARARRSRHGVLGRARARAAAALARASASSSAASPTRSRAGDVDAIVALLTDDAWLTMPPVPLEYQGRAAIGEFLRDRPRAAASSQRFRFVATRANGQPAFGLYLRDPHCAGRPRRRHPRAHARGRPDRAITVFHDTSVLPRFGLPRTLGVRRHLQQADLLAGQRLANCCPRSRRRRSRRAGPGRRS